MDQPSAFDLVRQSVIDHGLTDDEKLLEQLRITPDKKLPTLHFLFRIFGKPCFPRGELVAVTGKAKSGKTLFNSMLMACCVSEEVLQVQRPYDDVDGNWLCPPLHCMWYDTEQSEQSTQDILNNRVLPLCMGSADGLSQPASPSSPESERDTPDPCDQTSDYFDVFNVRSLHYDDRLRLFETAVRKYRPALVVLDGVRDLMADINDGVKAQEVVEHLMKLAHDVNCCLVCVLHQNKGAEDRNLRGWIGTELMNKAFEVYSCEKVKPENIFVVEQTHTRKYDLGELLFFRMDAESGLPVVCDAPTHYIGMLGYGMSSSSSGNKLPHMNREYLSFDENNKPHPTTSELFYEALKTGPLYYSDLQNRVMRLLNCSTVMWNNMFREMRDTGYIVRCKNREGKSMWQLPVAGSAEPVQPGLFSSAGAPAGDSPSS